MTKAIQGNEFLEHANFGGNMYGTSKKAVEDVVNTGRICILDVDEQGVKNVKETDLDARYVFIKPPSIQELESRLRGRGTENEDSFKKRMNTAVSAIKYAEQKDSYDIVIVNDIKDGAYQRLMAFLTEDIEQFKSSQAQ